MPAKKAAAATDGEVKPKKVNGLTKPMTVSKELGAIVGAKGEKLARSEIIKRLWAYLKEKKLQVRLIWTFLYLYYISQILPFILLFCYFYFY